MHKFEISLRIIFEMLYANNLENLELDKFLDTYDLLKLNQEDIKCLKMALICNEIGSVVKGLLPKKRPRL
jgi:hypothetical protein